MSWKWSKVMHNKRLTILFQNFCRLLRFFYICFVVILAYQHNQIWGQIVCRCRCYFHVRFATTDLRQIICAVYRPQHFWLPKWMKSQLNPNGMKCLYCDMMCEWWHVWKPFRLTRLPHGLLVSLAFKHFLISFGKFPLKLFFGWESLNGCERNLNHNIIRIEKRDT